MRSWLLVVSLLLLPATSQAACPVWERVFPPQIDCTERLPALDEIERGALDAAVQAHGERLGPEVGAEWTREVDRTLQDLPDDLKRAEVMDYIQCEDYKQGRVCKAQWEHRSDCLTLRQGAMGMEFSPGTAVVVEVESTQGVAFLGGSRDLPARARVTTSGALALEENRLVWRTGYTQGRAEIAVPESAGRWSLSFDALNTHHMDEWQDHTVDYSSGAPPPHRLSLRPDSHMSIGWSCPQR